MVTGIPPWYVQLNEGIAVEDDVIHQFEVKLFIMICLFKGIKKHGCKGQHEIINISALVTEDVTIFKEN